ncbi:hypothetical protein HK100_010348 [Physocladia obscura]|uniref:Autophagy-related protein n=1 Tax=Physocladia obscura TaxID=109957 RepID=A0AAD5XHL2_9FUNG|nr:hypothetical protein HK100_010348 [Physocladia obscura]
MISTFWSNVGWVVPLLIYLGIIYALNANPDAGQTDFTFNTNALLFGTYWLVFTIPYFCLSKKRPGPDIPAGVNVFVEGFVQANEALKLAKKLPHAWWYIVGFFLFCDGTNSAGIIIGNLQGIYVNYNLLHSSFFNLAQAICSMIGCMIFWKVQEIYKLQTKTMLQISNLLTLFMYASALVGFFIKNVGYRTRAVQNTTMGADSEIEESESKSPKSEILLLISTSPSFVMPLHSCRYAAETLAEPGDGLASFADESLSKRASKPARCRSESVKIDQAGSAELVIMKVQAKVEQLVSKSSQQWITYFLDNPVVHRKTGIRIHILGSSRLTLPSGFAATRDAIKTVNPSGIAIDMDPENYHSWLPEYSHFLAKNPPPLPEPLVLPNPPPLIKRARMSDNKKPNFPLESQLDQGLQWAKRNLPALMQTCLPLNYLTCLFRTGLVPASYDAAAFLVQSEISLPDKEPLTMLQLPELVEAELLYQNAANMRFRREEEMRIPTSKERSETSERFLEENLPLQEELEEIYAKYDVSKRMLDTFKTTESALFNAEIKGLIMGPEFRKEYDVVVKKWVQSDRRNRKRYLPFEKIREQKISNILRNINEICVRTEVKGHEDLPIVAVIEKKLVDEVIFKFNEHKYLMK